MAIPEVEVEGGGAKEEEEEEESGNAFCTLLLAASMCSIEIELYEVRGSGRGSG